MKHQHLLVALDLTEKKHPALHKAFDFVEKYDASYSVIYVPPHVLITMPYVNEIQFNIYEAMEKQAREKIQTLLASAPKAPQEIYVRIGSPGPEIAALAQEIKASLIVLNSHGKHGLALMLGSTANAVVHRAQSDVLTVRVNDLNDPLITQNYRNILLAVDFHHDNQAIVLKAKTLAETYKANLNVIHVVPDIAQIAALQVPGIEKEMRQQGRVSMTALAHRLNLPEGSTRVNIGCPEFEILKFAEEKKADLIILGAHGRRTWQTILIGSTAHGVLHATKTDVYLVHLSTKKEPHV